MIYTDQTKGVNNLQTNLMFERIKGQKSKKEMAKYLGLTPETYSAKEKDNLQFKADEMFLLSEYFGKGLDDIFLKRNFDNIEKVD